MEYKELHTRAMDIAERAMFAKIRSQTGEAIELFQEAFRLEKQAVEKYATIDGEEPTRSVLYRSAAALALNGKLFRESEQMVCLGIAGAAPKDILEELRDILEEIHFNRHLALKGIELEERDIQLSLAGGDAGLGMVQSDLFIEKFQTTEKMFYRIAERRKGNPFRERGRIEDRIKKDYQLFLSIPRAASYAVTIRIGKPSQQMILPGLDIVSEIVDELIQNLTWINSGQEEKLKDIMPDEDYLNNFIALAQQLAPDGKELSMVGFTANVSGNVKEIAVTRHRETIEIPRIKKNEKSMKVTIVGTLSFAEAKSKKIKITDKTGKDHLIVVDKALSDIVKPLWEDVVIAKGTRKTAKSEISLSSIDKFEGDSPP